MGLFGDILGGGSSNKASKKLTKQLVALYQDNKAKPFDITNQYYVGGDMGKGFAHPTLSKSVGQSFEDFNVMANKVGKAGRTLNSRGLAQEFFKQIDSLASRRDANEFNSLESKLFNGSGINTGTANQVADFRNQLEEGRQQRVFQATGAAQNYTSNLFNQFLGLVKGRADLGSSVLEPLKLASDISYRQQSGNTEAAKYAADAYGFQAQNTSNQGANKGSMIDDAISFATLFAGI